MPKPTDRSIQFAREFRRSRRARLVRRLLPLAAVLTLVGVLGRVWLINLTAGAIDVANLTIEGAKVTMANPQMSGFTASNRKYEITAQSAIQELTNLDIVYLNNIEAKFPIGLEDWANIKSSNGTIKKNENTLYLNNPIEAITTNGYDVKIRSGKLNLGTGVFEGSERVEMDLGKAHVTAKAVEIEAGGEVVVFERNVKTTINPN